MGEKKIDATVLCGHKPNPREWLRLLSSFFITFVRHGVEICWNFVHFGMDSLHIRCIISIISFAYFSTFPVISAPGFHTLLELTQGCFWNILKPHETVLELQGNKIVISSIFEKMFYIWINWLEIWIWNMFFITNTTIKFENIFDILKCFHILGIIEAF